VPKRSHYRYDSGVFAWGDRDGEARTTFDISLTIRRRRHVIPRSLPAGPDPFVPKPPREGEGEKLRRAAGRGFPRRESRLARAYATAGALNVRDKRIRGDE